MVFKVGFLEGLITGW